MHKFLLTSFTLSIALAASAVGPISVPDLNPDSMRIGKTITNHNAKALAADGDEWTVIGTGTYKDILFSDLFGKKAQTLNVTFEQNVSDPSLYRIPDVYENMDFSEYGTALTYNADNATPMVFHVCYDDYAYFEEFDTGVYIDYKNFSAGINFDGEVHMLMQGVDLLEYNTIETLIYYMPDALCSFQDGNFTMPASFFLQGRAWNNILGLVYVTGTPQDELFRGNQDGNFMVTLPGAGEYDPNADWRDLGVAQLTDVFTQSLTGQNTYPVWEVQMQQNRYDQDTYRLVNPFANFKGSIPGVTYDSENNYYMTLIMQHYDEFTLVGIPAFLTGLKSATQGGYTISNQAANELYDSTDWLRELYLNAPGCLGMLENGVITYSADCYIMSEGGAGYRNFYGYFGSFSYDKEFYDVNPQGNFRLVMPGAGGSGVEAVAGAEDSPVEYYNMQGIRVENPLPGQMIIKKQGEKSKLILYK